MADAPKRTSPLAEVWGALEQVAKRLVASEKRHLTLRISGAFEMPAGTKLSARELDVNGKTIKIITIEDDNS